MKITLRPILAGDDTQDVILADGADRAADNVRGPAMGVTTVSLLDQPVRPIGATYSRFIGRGNRAGTYTFKTSRRFASLPDAGRFLLTHAMSCPQEGTLIFDFGSGAYVAIFGAVIRQIGQFEQVGVTIRANYTVGYGYAAEVTAAALQGDINTFYGYAPSRTINCGGAVSDDWEADADFDAESGAGEVPGVTVIKKALPRPETIFKTFRFGEWTYAIPLPAGTYDITLSFSEPEETTVGERVFDVWVDGTKVLENFDIFDNAEETNSAVAVDIDAVVFDGGDLIINATAVIGEPLICGIEISPTTPPEPTP